MRIHTQLIIDGSYLLHKNTFAFKNKMYGHLYDSFVYAIEKWAKFYPWDKIWITSDKGKSWRKTKLDEYKEHRIKDDKIDWEFAYEAWSNVQEDYANQYNWLETRGIEGDDWISVLSKKNGFNLIIANDGDLEQLLEWSTNPLRINVMSNEKWGKSDVTIGENYQYALNYIKDNYNTDIFTDSNDVEFITWFEKWLNFREVKEVNPNFALMKKLICGDKGDGVPSCWSWETKGGKTRGIGSTGAEKLVTKYFEEIGEPIWGSEETIDALTDIIIENKKIDYKDFDKLKNNINRNWELMSLLELPKEIDEKIDRKLKDLEWLK